jgi:hypothetical protein
MIGVTAENCSGRLAVFCIHSGFYILFQAGKQFSAVTPVICKACQIGNQSSAVTPVICDLYQAGKSLL